MTTPSSHRSYRLLTALPVYNEARHVPDVLAEVGRYSPDVLVVDDGSTDDTPKVLAALSNVHVVTHEAISATARHCGRPSISRFAMRTTCW